MAGFIERTQAFARGAWKIQTMVNEFYLESGDLGDSMPRKCEVIREVVGMRRNSHYLLVRVTPPITSRFWDGPRMDHHQVILSRVNGCGLEDVGKRPVMVEIVICPSYSEGCVDETQCSRVGTGGLHSDFGKALSMYNPYSAPPR